MLLGSIKVSGSIPVSDFFILFILVIKNLLFGQSGVRVHAFLWILPRLYSDCLDSVKIRQKPLPKKKSRIPSRVQAESEKSDQELHGHPMPRRTFPCIISS